jgi:hypothetical protein
MTKGSQLFALIKKIIEQGGYLNYFFPYIMAFRKRKFTVSPILSELKQLSTTSKMKLKVI